MKSKILLLQVALIVFFTLLFAIVQDGEIGQLHNDFLREKIFPPLRTVSGTFSNLKFRIRGEERPKNKIVIVAIDDVSLESIGRWPWHRNFIALLIDQIFNAGAKVVGLDIVFSEPDPRVPDELKDALARTGYKRLAEEAETDPMLAAAVEHYQERLVTGWMPLVECQPEYTQPKDCPLNGGEGSFFPKGFGKFAVQNLQAPTKFDPYLTTVPSVSYFLPNIPVIQERALHSGSLAVDPDPDGVIRRSTLVWLSNGMAFGSLALEMAKVGLNEEIAVHMSKALKITSIKFKKSNQAFSVTPQGVLEMNFRGGRYAFPHLSAVEVMSDEQLITTVIPGATNRKVASLPRSDLLKDAYVLVGVTSKGVFDMRTFPFDSNVAGVEGHATVLDNILARDFLVPASTGHGRDWIFLLMTVGALVFAYLTNRFESLPALALFLAVVGGTGVMDQKLLFENRVNWDLSFFYLEVISIFFMTLAYKYVAEEGQKKFLTTAFGRYVSPAVVATLVKDPKRLSLGGEKKELTILFSDIRSFTTLSERMDAKALAKFLNEYLGEMTSIIVNEFNGTLDKYIGDAIMSFWSAPIEQKNHGQLACRAATRMQQRLREMRETFKKSYGIDVHAGIGLNSGLVNVGNMGSEKNFNYTVIGDHVNLASRLEGLTKYYGVNILTSRFTLDVVEQAGMGLPPFRVLDRVKVKGKKQAVEIVEVLDRDMPAQAIKLFDQARSYYEQKLWDEACQLFEKTQDLLRPEPDSPDGPSAMYLERCKMFKENPPNADWDGSWEMTSK